MCVLVIHENVTITSRIDLCFTSCVGVICHVLCCLHKSFPFGRPEMPWWPSWDKKYVKPVYRRTEKKQENCGAFDRHVLNYIWNFGLNNISMLLDSLAVQQRCGRKCRIWNMALASRRDHCLQCLGFVGSCWVVGDPFGVSMVSVLSHDRDWDDLGAPQRLRKHLNNSLKSCSKIIIPIRIPCYNAMIFWWSRVQKIFVEWCWMVSSW